MLLSEIKQVIGSIAEVEGDGSQDIRFLLTDSRQLGAEPQATLFFAIKTDKNDGANYISELQSRGVKAFVRGNALAALQALAAHVRSQFAGTVIGITGSNGKTVVKEWLYQLLKEDYTVVRSPKSYNSQIGVPLSVWQLEPHLTSPQGEGNDPSVTPVILAIGHSAHDTYRMLATEGVALETKGFAMGVRAEHPQSLINQLMYHSTNVEYVGNASYSLVTQVDGRGVYSFCMCPGGHIVPAGSEAGSCVVNGMSASHRNSPYANSGMVVQINPEDIEGENPLRGLEFQEALERLAFEHGGPQAQAPAQRLKDFVEGRASKDLPACSYLPGIVPSRLDLWLPVHIGKRLQQGFRDFDRKYPGFLTNEAVILGVESRSSSAVRIPRDPETLESISTPGLYPCGEGAGYAGGITSSALDGINAALAISKKCAEE